jgi:glycosyltransferase involved in cell wall biosynthesis
VNERVLLLFPGPHYDLEHDFRVRLEGLSERSLSGQVITSAPEKAQHRFGSFHVDTLSIEPSSSTAPPGSYLLRGLRLALRAARRLGRFDVVVAYDPIKTGLLGLLIARLQGARLAIELNGDYSADANYADDRGEHFSRRRKSLYMAISSFVLRRASGIRLLYPEQLDPFGPAITQGKVIRVFWDYVDLRPFRNLEEQKIVLFAGFPFYLKGVDVLIDAFKEVAKRHPDWKLKILGWFPDRAFMDSVIDGHPQIFLHPSVHHVHMPEHMGACGIFVLPSRTEAMGRTLLEAMAAGKARIASDVGGVGRVVADGEDGFLFPAEDTRSLARLLDRLMGDARLRREIGGAAAARALREFTLDRYFVNAASFYADVGASRP